MPPWKRALPPGFIVPMQPSLVVRVPEGPDWQHEIKHDGYRIIARKEGPRVRLWSRTGRDWRNVFTGIALAVAALPATSLMIDGEAVVLHPDGTSDFHALASSRARAACLIAFDILQIDGMDMRTSPLEARRDLLAAILREHTSASLFFSEAVEGETGAALFRHACNMGLEGIISKRKGSPYRSGPSTLWRKIRCPNYAAGRRMNPGNTHARRPHRLGQDRRSRSHHEGRREPLRRPRRRGQGHRRREMDRERPGQGLAVVDDAGASRQAVPRPVRHGEDPSEAALALVASYRAFLNGMGFDGRRPR